MPYYTRRSLDEWSFLRSRRHRRRPSPTKYPAPCSPAALTKYSVLIRILCQVLRSYQLPAAQFKYLLYLFLCTPFSSIHLVNRHLSHLIWCTPLSLANSRCWSRPWLPCQAGHNGFGKKSKIVLLSLCFAFIVVILYIWIKIFAFYQTTTHTKEL